MYVTDTLKEVLRDMLQESDYYFVLAEIESAYDSGYCDGFKDGFKNGNMDGYGGCLLGYDL